MKIINTRSSSENLRKCSPIFWSSGSIRLVLAAFFISTILIGCGPTSIVNPEEQKLAEEKSLAKVQEDIFEKALDDHAEQCADYSRWTARFKSCERDTNCSMTVSELKEYAGLEASRKYHCDATDNLLDKIYGADDNVILGDEK